MSKRDEYVAKMKLQLDELNAKMDELEAKAKGAKEDARDKYKEEMGKLRHQSKLAVAKLDELKASGEDKWEVMGRSTQTIESFYQRGGLCVQAMHSKPADHISIQFEFMYYLNFKLIETGDLEYLELQKEFLYRIMTHWIPKFNATIQEHAELAIYKHLGNLTERFIQLDYSSL